CPTEPAYNSALPCGVPSFEQDNGTFTGPEIGLLDRLHDGLHRFQPTLIVCKPNRWMRGNLCQRRASNDNKVLGFHASVNAPAIMATRHHQAQARGGS